MSSCSHSHTCSSFTFFACTILTPSVHSCPPHPLFVAPVSPFSLLPCFCYRLLPFLCLFSFALTDFFFFFSLNGLWYITHIIAFLYGQHLPSIVYSFSEASPRSIHFFTGFGLATVRSRVKKHPIHGSLLYPSLHHSSRSSDHRQYVCTRRK